MIQYTFSSSIKACNRIPSPGIFNLLLLLARITILFNSYKKEELDEKNCRIFGIPDRLPAAMVSLESMYVSVEFIYVDNDGDLDLALRALGNPGAPADQDP
ncbi:hypothetical protein N9933_02935 [bacterium]|nr:hypothetical protein [bacterium]